MRFIFIGSNENPNAGFRDYAMSLAFELQGMGAQALACKINGNPEREGGLAVLETNNVSYSVLPAYDAQKLLADLPADEPCVILGLGDPTFDALCEVYDQNTREDVSFGFVSHLLEPSAQKALETRHITAFTRSIDVDPIVDHVHLESVPHTATAEILKFHGGELVKNGDERIAEIINLKKAFAVAVLNAGFEVETPEGHKKYAPYTAEEAFDHGFSLGRLLPQNTDLILVDGGPRNLRDIDAGEETGLAFHAGYHDANNTESFRTDFIEDVTGERLQNMVAYCRRGISLLDWPDYMYEMRPPAESEIQRTPVPQINASRLIIETFAGQTGGRAFTPWEPRI